MDKIVLTPLKRIENPKGDLLHVMKKSDESFHGYGEAYFTSVHYQDIKGWKKHSEMVLNLVVPVGIVEFVIYDEKSFYSVVLSQENYQRLTVHPGVWMAFRGVGKELNLVLNLANIEHDPNESVNCELEEITYEW